jgi:hypothetical protein
MDYYDGGNPFAVIGSVVAPVILTSACSVGAEVGSDGAEVRVGRKAFFRA